MRFEFDLPARHVGYQIGLVHRAAYFTVGVLREVVFRSGFIQRGSAWAPQTPAIIRVEVFDNSKAVFITAYRFHVADTHVLNSSWLKTREAGWNSKNFSSRIKIQGSCWLGLGLLYAVPGFCVDRLPEK